MTDVWIAYHKSDIYDGKSSTVAVCASRAIAKKRLMDLAEKEGDRYRFGLDDYRWFDSHDVSRWAPKVKPIRLVNARGQVHQNLDEVDYRNDWLYTVRYHVEGP